MSTLTNSLKLSLIIAADLIDAVRSQLHIEMMAGHEIRTLDISTDVLHEIVKAELAEYILEGDQDEINDSIGDQFMSFLVSNLMMTSARSGSFTGACLGLAMRIHYVLSQEEIKVKTITWGNDPHPTSTPAR